jgi:hypothetical protein
MPKPKRPRAETATPPQSGHTPAGPHRVSSREVSTHLLHGLCYGLGTGLTGLVFWYIQQTL